MAWRPLLAGIATSLWLITAALAGRRQPASDAGSMRTASASQ